MTTRWSEGAGRRGYLSPERRWSCRPKEHAKPSLSTGGLSRQVDQLETGPPSTNEQNYATLLQLCGKLRCLAEGKRIHRHLHLLGLDASHSLGSKLMRMYLECGSLDAAKQAFAAMNKTDLKAWNSAIAVFARNGHLLEALKLFEKMKDSSTLVPSRITLITVLNALALNPCTESLDAAISIHRELVDPSSRFPRMHLFVATSLVNVYARCGSLQEAKALFDSTVTRDTAMWSTMISAYAESGNLQETMMLFRWMQLEGARPNEIVLVNALGAVTCLEDLSFGSHLHFLILSEFSGGDRNIILITALISMYGRCGCIAEAAKIFENIRSTKDVVVWNAMIGAYAQAGLMKDAMDLAWAMKSSTRTPPGRVTFIMLFGGFSRPDLFDEVVVSVLRQEVIERGYDTDVVVASSMIKMYGQCGRPDHARQVFDSLNSDLRTEVTWNTMISAYSYSYSTSQTAAKEALTVFHLMQQHGIRVAKITLLSVLDACANIPDLAEGAKLHNCVWERGYQTDCLVATALVDMYCKCGRFNMCKRAFDAVPDNDRDIVLWTALVSAYSHQGDTNMSIKTFHHMQLEGVRPGKVAFLALLSACRHSGMVDEGCLYFSLVVREYGLTITTEQMSCMVDLLARAGRLKQAEQLVLRIPEKSTEARRFAWMAVLDAAKRQGSEQELCQRAAERIMELNAGKSSTYIMLSNMYAGREA